MTDGDCYIYSITQRFNFRQRSIFTVTISNSRRTCIDSFSPSDRQLWLLITIITFATIQALLIMRYWLRAFKQFQKLQKRFSRKIEREKLLEGGVGTKKRRKEKESDTVIDASVYDKFEKKNERYLNKIQQNEKLPKDDEKPRTLSMEMPVYRSKSTNADV
jgi:hypothetical protein